LTKVTKRDEDRATRRGILRAGLAVVTGGAMAAVAAKAEAQDKLAQAIVQYQETPKDGAKCADCVNFEAPAGCKIVSGTINPNGWCIAFAPKS
jgi:hypothetical protein